MQQQQQQQQQHSPIRLPRSLSASVLLLVGLVLLSLTAPAGAAVIPSTAFVQWSFDNCQADVICSLALPSGSDIDVFAEMLLMYLEMRSDMGATIVPIVEPCVQPTLPLDPCVGCTITCSMIQALWLAIMREARVCHINEEWLEGQCRCIEGKNCHEDCIAERAINWQAILAGTIITLALVIVISGWIHWGQQKISTSQDKFDIDVWTLRQALMRLSVELKSRTLFGPPQIPAAISSLDDSEASAARPLLAAADE